MMYLGTPGRMVALKCPTQQRVTPTGRYSFTTTLAGVVKSQFGPPARRTWDVGLGSLTTPSEVGTLMEFTAGAWGPGPFWFVPTDAPVVNVLPPKVAACDPDTLTPSWGATILGSPPLDLGADGIAAQSVWKSATGTVTLGDPVPVLPGKPVTGSAWVAGGGQVRLEFLDAAGAVVSAADSTTLTRPVGRLAVTATSDTAVSARLVITAGATHAARPAITWTPQPYEWGDGQGCPKAIVHSPTRDVTNAWDHPTTGRWSDVAFTVQEVA